MEKLSTLDPKHVRQILNSIPLDLELRLRAEESLQNFICERAKFLVSSFAELLFDQIELVVT